MQGHDGRHAIVFVARLKAILQRHAQWPGLRVIGKVTGIDIGIGLGGDVLCGQPQQLGLFDFGLFAPALKGCAAGHIGRDALIKKRL